ncbi:MAG: GNAT family N-acetyltransferase [Janthinobacterium lividum]
MTTGADATRPATILLDLDGTLADSAPGILGSYRRALIALGHEPDPDFDMNFVIGPVMADVMPHVLAHYGDDRVEEAIALYRHYYGEAGLFQAQLYPGMAQLLKALSAAGCRLFLATAKRVEFAEQMLEHFGITALFEGIYGSVAGNALDHKKDLIAHILERADADPADVVMVGDRRYDISGAHANGVRALGVLWGYGGRAELEQAGADALAATVAELEVLLLGSLVRAAGREDLDGIMQLYRSFPSYNPDYDARAAGPDWDMIQAQPGMTVVVAEVDGVIVSSCMLAVIPNITYRGQPWAMVENVITHPDWRCRGLGNRVLAFAASLAWEAGCFKVGMMTTSKREATLRFYEGAGFRRSTKTYLERRRRR